MQKMILQMKMIRMKKHEGIFILIVLGFVCVIHLFSGIFQDTVNSWITMEINKNIDTRMIRVNKLTYSEKEEAAIEKYDHVVAAFPIQGRSSSQTFFSKDIEGFHIEDARILGCNEQTTPQIVEGRNLNFLASDEIIVPDIIVLDNGKKINGKELLNKTLSTLINKHDYTPLFTEKDGIPMKIDEKELSFQVVGVYNTGDTITPEANSFFLPYNILIEIGKYDEGNLSQFQDYPPTMYVVVDDISNLNNVMKRLRQEGYHPSLVYVLFTEIITTFNFIAAILFIISTILALFMIYSITKRNINQNKINIALLKSMGYPNHSVLILYILSTIQFCIWTVIFALILYGLASGPLSEFFFSGSMHFGVSGKLFVILLLEMLVFPIISVCLTSHRLFRISPAVLMKEVL